MAAPHHQVPALASAFATAPEQGCRGRLDAIRVFPPGFSFAISSHRRGARGVHALRLAEPTPVATVRLGPTPKARVGVLSEAFRLPGGGGIVDAKGESHMDKPSGVGTGTSWRCKVGMHTWVKRTNDEGGRYLECSRCGKEDNIPDSAGPRIVG
jgi:hypothetical protein